MTYGRIEREDDLVVDDRAGGLRERSTLAFRAHADPKKPTRHARDVASFANALGGVILVGVEQRDGRAHIRGLEGQTFAEVCDVYEHAAAICSPSPVVAVRSIHVDDETTLAAVNVDAYLDQVVAAPASPKRVRKDGSPALPSWTFPIRTSTQTRHLVPAEIAMYMNREARRVLVLLSRIPLEARREIFVWYRERRDLAPKPWDGTYQTSHLVMRLEDVSLEGNAVLLARATGGGSLYVRAPLTDVIDVWEHRPGEWSMRLDGLIFLGTDRGVGRLEYVPLVK